MVADDGGHAQSWEEVKKGTKIWKEEWGGGGKEEYLAG